MTIEQKLNKEIGNFAPWRHYHHPVEEWSWEGPMSLDIKVSPGTKAGIKEAEVLGCRIRQIIENADPSECLTSKSEYVREYKKYLMECGE